MERAGDMQSVNFDSIARTYERRYQHNQYVGVERELLRFVGSEPAAVLEVGCGTGHWLEVLRAQGHAVVGLDASREMLKQAAARLPDVPLDFGAADALPYRPAGFDRVFCIGAFHHFGQKQKFLAEARRVLRPGGGLMIVDRDPHTGLDRSWFYDYFPTTLATDRARFPPTETIRGWMAESGFERVETSEAQHIDQTYSADVALAQGRLDKSQTSQLALLSDDEYQIGMARLCRDIEAAARRGEAFRIVSDLPLYATTGWVRTTAQRPKG